MTDPQKGIDVLASITVLLVAALRFEEIITMLGEVRTFPDYNLLEEEERAHDALIQAIRIYKRIKEQG